MHLKCMEDVFENCVTVHNGKRPCVHDHGYVLLLPGEFVATARGSDSPLQSPRLEGKGWEAFEKTVMTGAVDFFAWNGGHHLIKEKCHGILFMTEADGFWRLRSFHTR